MSNKIQEYCRKKAVCVADLFTRTFEEYPRLVSVGDRTGEISSVMCLPSFLEIDDDTYRSIQDSLNEAFKYAAFSDMSIDDKINLNDELRRARENVRNAREQFIRIYNNPLRRMNKGRDESIIAWIYYALNTFG